MRHNLLENVMRPAFDIYRYVKVSCLGVRSVYVYEFIYVFLKLRS